MATGGTTATLRKHGSVRCLKLVWLSTAGGAVQSDPIGADGSLVWARLASDGGGTAPTDLYDVTVTDEHGADLLAGGGANVTAATTVELHQRTTSLGFAGGTITLTVANAGAAKGGTVYLYFR